MDPVTFCTAELQASHSRISQLHGTRWSFIYVADGIELRVINLDHQHVMIQD